MGQETGFFITKQEVLTQEPQKIENLGKHFIVGYWDFQEVKNLVEKRAIGGVFITQRNAYNKNYDKFNKKSNLYKQFANIKGYHLSGTLQIEKGEIFQDCLLL